MNFKKKKVIGVFIIFGLSFLFHFLYSWFPNTIFSFLFPVNESIWEHMKLLFTPFIFYTIIEWLFSKDKSKNLLVQLFLIPFISIVLYLAIYLPIFNIIGENMAVSIILLFIIICFEQVMSYFLGIAKPIKNEKVYGILGLIITFALFIYFTYYPPKILLFHDLKDNYYGIKKV